MTQRLFKAAILGCLVTAATAWIIYHYNYAQIWERVTRDVKWPEIGNFVIATSAFILSLKTYFLQKRQNTELFKLECTIAPDINNQHSLILTFRNVGRIPIVLETIGLATKMDQNLLIPKWDRNRVVTPSTIQPGDKVAATYLDGDSAVQTSLATACAAVAILGSGRIAKIRPRALRTWRAYAKRVVDRTQAGA